MNVKERIVFGRTEELLREFQLIQKEQLELDKARKELAEVRKLVRSKCQLIPDRIRRLKF